MTFSHGKGIIYIKYSYNAWGVPTILSDTSDCAIATVNPFRYRGYYYDVETGWYYLQSRYYDPGVGRFLNADASIYVGTERDNICTLTLQCYL